MFIFSHWLCSGLLLPNQVLQNLTVTELLSGPKLLNGKLVDLGMQGRLTFLETVGINIL